MIRMNDLFIIVDDDNMINGLPSRILYFKEEDAKKDSDHINNHSLIKTKVVNLDSWYLNIMLSKQ